MNYHTWAEETSARELAEMQRNAALARVKELEGEAAAPDLLAALGEVLSIAEELYRNACRRAGMTDEQAAHAVKRGVPLFLRARAAIRKATATP
jgi:hypothetical protein